MIKRSLLGLYYRVKYYPRFKGWIYEFTPCSNGDVTFQLRNINNNFCVPICEYKNND